MSEPDGPEKRIGTIIRGKWTIEALLGVGGMASVYSASHRNGQRAALKILHADFARDKGICERFLREAYVSNKIGHRATVEVMDDDRTDDDSPYLIMELLVGQTLRDLWRNANRQLPIAQVLQIADDVLDCLVACHAISVIHRDLKPANIFVTNAGVTKVLDFGVAQMRSATTERTATGTALGTPAYMSPEQAMGLVDQLDGRADLFSVGAMLHLLLTGHRINNGRTEAEALVMAATTPAPSVARIAPGLPLEIIKLIDKALAWDRRNRYADAREMQAAVREVLQSLARPAESVNAAAQQSTGLRKDIEIPFVEGELPLDLTPGPSSRSPSHAPGPVSSSMARPTASQPPGSVRSLPPSITPAPLSSQRRSPTSPPSQVLPALQSGFRSVSQMQAVRQQSAVPPPILRQSAPPGAPAAGAPGEVPADLDPRVEALRDLFRRVDRLLPSVRQFGWEHPATERTLLQTFDGFADSLAKDPDLIHFTVRPYSFLHRGQSVWEPGPPFDIIPYNLFACGVRGLRMKAGITKEELKDVLSLMMLDPARDLPPEDDLAAAFWERAFPHVEHEVCEAFAQGGAAEREAFYGESDALERIAAEAGKRDIDRIEARAMVVSTDRAALADGRRPSPFALEGQIREAAVAQLSVGNDVWSERYVRAITDGYIDAAISRDAPLVLASLRKSSADLVVAGRLSLVVTLHDAIVLRLGKRLDAPSQARLASALTNAVFGGEALDLALKSLHAKPEQLSFFAPILDRINPAELPRLLHAYRAEPPRPVAGALLRSIARTMTGQEARVSAAAVGIAAEYGNSLLGLLARAGTEPARDAIKLLVSSEDMNVRLEARAILMGDEATNEIALLCDHAVPVTRIAALRTLARYGLKGGWSAVARVVKAADFNERGQDERIGAFRALILLAPERGEPIAIELAKKGGVFVSEGREETRIAAIEALGELSKSSAVVTELREIGLARWGTGEETRAAATLAANRIIERIGGIASPDKASTP